MRRGSSLHLAVVASALKGAGRRLGFIAPYTSTMTNGKSTPEPPNNTLTRYGLLALTFPTDTFRSPGQLVGPRPLTCTPATAGWSPLPLNLTS